LLGFPRERIGFCACNHAAVCRFDIHSGNDEADRRLRLIQFCQCVMAAFASVFSSRFCSVFFARESDPDELTASEWHSRDVCYACADIVT
jgi:hypothetical protein